MESNFSVFSFNTIKSPEKHSDEIVANHSIKIDMFNTPIKSTAFIDTLKEALAPRTLDSLQSARRLIDTFKIGGSTLNDEEQINQKVNNVLIVHKELISLSVLPDNFSTSIPIKLGIDRLADVSTTPYQDKWNMLWNNFFAELLKPTNPKHRNNLVNALRVFKLLKKIQVNGIRTIGDLKMILDSSIYLPEGIFPLHLKSPQQVNVPINSKKDELIAKLRFSNEIKSTLEELIIMQDKYRVLAKARQNEISALIRNRTNDEMANIEVLEPIDFLNLTADKFDTLTPLSKSVLSNSQIAIESGESFSNVQNKVSKVGAFVESEIYGIQQAVMGGVFSNGVLYSAKDYTFGQYELEPFELGQYEAPIDWINLPKCRVKPLGVSDYRKVEAVWKKYEAGEIAHIENLLKGEYKDRETRHLRRSEDTYTFESIKENEVIRDLQTTERFGLQKEASKIVEKDFTGKVDAYVKGSYGAVSFGVSGGLSSSQSSTKSNLEASQYAKEVIDKSVSRILERTREERTIKILEEFEEKNVHKLDNVAGTDHVVGVYRWVDKIMQCKLVNYGKRLLFEFMVPEPAAFHIFAKTHNSFKGVNVEKPIHPKVGISNPLTNTVITLTNPESLTESTYKIWASAYGAEVEPYPQNINIAKAFKETLPNTGGWIHNAEADNSIKLPDGYQSYGAILSYSHDTDNGHSFSVTVAETTIDSWSIWANTPNGYITLVIDKIIDTIPVSWTNNNSSAITLNIEINCEPTATKIDEWKMKTFNTIMFAYERKLEAFNNAVSEAQVSQGVTINGNNPLQNREIEKNELKKSCIQLMTENDFFYQFNAMDHSLEPNPTYDNYPRFDNCEAIKEGHIVKFHESILEWDIMSYYFHPYFWANRKNWVEIYNAESVDPLHTSFLQAGFARVVVPVRLGFEEIAMSFIETNVINYDSALIANSPEALDVKIELGQNNFLKTIPDPLDPTYPDWLASDLNPANFPSWEVRLPTNLVVLQQDGTAVSGSGLPVNPNA